MKQFLAMKFWQDRRGNIVTVAALVLPCFVLLATGAVDLARYSNQSGRLEGIAEMGAITGARQMILANMTETEIKAAAKQAVARVFTAKFPDQA